MTKTVLVTGVNGFAGQHTARTLKSRGCQVVGVGINPDLPKELAPFVDKYIACDLTDPAQVSKINTAGIDAVINLAGIAVNNPNEQDQSKIIKLNTRVHTVLYEHLAQLKSDFRVVAVSTGAVYTPDSPMPLKESSPLVELSKATAYIKSKLMLEQELGKFSNDLLDIVVVRPFNHTGPGQMPGFLVPDWTDKISKADDLQKLDVSGLGSWRDFTDVRDVAEAYADLALCEKAQLKHRLYNICSGQPEKTYDIVNLIAKKLGGDLPVLEPSDHSNKIFGDHTRLSQDTGWQPKISITQTVDDFVDWYNSAKA
jgi:GDP-4-dehydro-6-deoxy-D-mannose reductase